MRGLAEGEVVIAISLNSCGVSGYRRRTPKYRPQGSRTRLSALQSWLRRGPPENGYTVRRVSFRLHDRNQVDIDVGVRILVLVGITSDRIDPWFGLHPSPTIRRQHSLQFVDEPYETTVGFFLVPDRQSIAGDIVSDAVNTAIHACTAGLKKFYPSSVFIPGPQNCLKSSPPAASATASCRSRSLPWLVSIGDETLVSVATLEVASDAKDVSPAPKPLTKNKAVKIEVARYIVFTPF